MLATLLALAVTMADCNNDSIGATPLIDFQPKEYYLGVFSGGLYPNGQNTLPPNHSRRGLSEGNKVVPRNTSGFYDPNGKIVFLSIGFSNVKRYMCNNEGAEPCDPGTTFAILNHGPHVVLANIARGGQAADEWVDQVYDTWDRGTDDVLTPLGVTPAQVQVIFCSMANQSPSISLPSLDADAFRLRDQLAEIARIAKTRYPNLRQMFLTSRIYGGYAEGPLNPEPYAYESGFAVKWVISRQISQLAGAPPSTEGPLTLDVAPWMAWAPYLWADGATPRSDGLTWDCPIDFAQDGVHPSPTGRAKAANLIAPFFETSVYTPWIHQ